MAEAAEHRPRLADALMVAAAERLDVHRIATFDRRPIAVLRPRHVRSFDLEP
jgi:predicted nucleic acid-binding protein